MQNKRFLFFFVFLLSAVITRADNDQLTTLSISAGQKYALALRSDGTVWAWGTNQVGEIGLGTNTLVLWPTRIAGITNAVSISASSLHSLAVQSNGTVWAWGLNGDGRLGNGNFNTASNPVAVTRITNAIMVSAGGSHSLGLLANGSVMAWGANIGGQLGTGNIISTNQPVAAGSFTNAIAVSAGTNFSLALCQDGSVWAWGTNNLGQLGLGSTSTQLTPVKITTLSNIVQIAAGASHTLALDRNGVVYAWGRNTEGQIGNGTTINATAPVVVPSFGATTNLGAVKNVEAGYNSSAAILKSGRLFYWGWYGNGTSWSSNQPPQELNANSGQVFTSVTYGDSYLLTGTQDGSTWAWGFNQYGQWGNGNVYDTGDIKSYGKGNALFSFSSSPYPEVTRFNRGNRNDNAYATYLPYDSFVLPLDLEKGVRLNNQGSDPYCYGANVPWFLRVQKNQRQHAWDLIGSTTNLSRFPVDNPIVAFGSDAGGSPLYAGQPYSFGIYAGAYDEKNGTTNRIRILVYDRSVLASGATNVAPVNIINIPLPRRYVAADNTAWSNFVTNGNRVVVETNGLRTVVQFADGQNVAVNWGLGWNFAVQTNVDLCGYMVTQTAASTNYSYIVEGIGSVEVGANILSPMGVTNNVAAYLPLYAASFDAFPPLFSHFVDNPTFWGTPVPSTYAGRSIAELSGMSAVITNNIWITNNPAYTNLDNSPELRRHPILDQFVSDMRGDPLALVNYVINNIEITDPMASIESAQKVAESIEVGGVNRSALATFLEGQGSPVEQCALLVYLLRSAGYSAAYVWPTNSNLKLLDTTVSRLWQINVHSAVSFYGLPVISNALITVNYPWVVANIGTNTVQIFPWLKNTEIVEGQDIYDYMPANYPDAYSWIKAYAFADPTIFGLGSPNDTTVSIWKKWLTNLINTNQFQSNLSLDDFGVRAFNRPTAYTSWSQLPMPNFLGNQSQVAVVQTLSDSPITFPFLTNRFDTIRIEVFNNDTNTANRIFDTGNWRACDFHNRKLLLFTNGVNTVNLWLSPYRPSITTITNFQNFSTGTNSLDVQLVQASTSSAVTNFPVRITYTRRDSTLVNPAPWWYETSEFLPPAAQPTLLTCRKIDVSAILPGVSKVTPQMLQVHAQNYWTLQQQKALNPNYTPALTDEVGDAAMIMGSSFFQKLWSDDQFNQHLHKVHGMSWFSQGVSALTHLTNSMQLKLNMNWFATYIIGNATMHQDSGDSRFAIENYMAMLLANGASAEHSTIASVWGDANPVSTMRLVQLASQRAASNGWAPPMELNIKNYSALGNLSYTGYGGTLLKNQTPSLWATITNTFSTEWDSNYVRVIITPGMVTNATGSFKGMGAFLFGKWQGGAIISDNQVQLNGGSDLISIWIGGNDFISTYNLSYNLDYSSASGSYSFIPTSISVSAPLPQFNFSAYAALNLTSSSGQPQQIAFTPQQVTQASLISAGLNLGNNSTANAIKAGSDAGWFGNAWARIKQAASVVSDPVQVVSGDFCADSVDIALAGPMPLPLHRNYQSRNLATAQVGAGWKFGIMPWLVVVTNSAGSVIANAAEMDGSVLAYRQQTNGFWTVTTADNPDLANFSPNGIGGIANVFNNYILPNPTNSQIYTLFGSDGSQRVFQVMTNFGIANGSNYLNRIRPYLTLWQDHSGNYYQFIYGTNSGNNNFGQLYRIQGANGASLTFQYDFYGRVTQVLSDDNRTVNYQYDNYGDLVSVTLPDNSSWQYEYQHYTFTTNSATYTDSTHLLVKETKPNGRQLANTYDNLRRVIAQAATVGVNRELITNATFFYTNNCTGLTNSLISGVTAVKDVFGNPYYYYYTNNLLTQIIEPLGRTNTQNWYVGSETNKPGYYQNSLEYTVDVRGLTNAFFYDSNGNVTNQTIYGDLAGTGAANQSATNTFTFTTNNLLQSSVNPAGGGVFLLYEDGADAWRPSRAVQLGGGVSLATNRFYYTNVSEVISLATTTRTNQSFGLLARVVLADSATNEWAYNGRGFPTQLTRYAATADVAGNSDPAVITYLTFTPRGDLAEQVDAQGRRLRMNFDAMGRRLSRDVLDESGTAVARENFYYNRNGDLEWYDGPRSNPDDLIWFSYDGSGRKVEQIQWRSRAKADGTGIEAETGDNLYATTFFAYDSFGNLTKTIDPRGAVTTNTWDALGRLSQRKTFDTDGTTLLATEGFAYEIGGQVKYHTNALGGVTTTLYTQTGQPYFRATPEGATNGWTYYLDGRVRREIQNNGAYWETTYNDAALTTTRIFYSASGNPLATNLTVRDRRGNPAQWTDAAGNTFTNYFDGLGRLKCAAGPAIVTVTGGSGGPGGMGGGYSTNVLQQILTRIYDSSGKTVTISNALGEKTTTTFDTLGRTLGVQTYAAGSSTPLLTSTITYAADNNSFTTTSGSGANAISTTTYTDTDGQSLLSISSPSADVNNLTLRKFDLVGNLSAETQASIINNRLTTWQTSSFTRDGLNRVKTLTERDNALTSFSYNSAGNLTSRVMPGASLTWSATYNNAGQILSEQDSSGSSVTHSNTYAYYSAGNPLAGLLNTATDGNGVTRTVAYDDWLRATNMACSGSLSEQQMTLGWTFDARGIVTSLTQSFASTNTGPAVSVSRTFDAYGQLTTESVNGGSFSYGNSQAWDAAGRRTQLAFGGGWNASFQYRADGLMTASGGGTFGYADNGLLTGRTNAFRTLVINQRDGVGRPLQATTSVSGGTALVESWNWLGDGSPAAYIAQRSDFTDTRNFAYGSLNRRLIQESLNVADGQSVNNAYTFDNGAAGGMGILTKVVQDSSPSPSWSGVTDTFSRIVKATNSVAHRPAYGQVNGKATITALLDGHPVATTVVGTNGGQWRATLDLTPGPHQLTAMAAHPSGLFVTNATVTFTNNAADTSTNTFDGNGQITQRVWLTASGQTNRIQTFTWDAFGRLVKASERDSQSSGYNWQADFDPLGRRIRTTTVNVTNNVVITSQPTAIIHYYDPQVEFLEIGVTVNGGLTTWKNYGPDLDGGYGSQQGLGGLESLTTGYSSVGLIQDGFGNVLASVTNGTVSWNAARMNGYGPQAGYPALSLNSSLTAEHLAWRGKWRDMTSLYYWGARPYDAESRTFLSADPLGHAADDSLYSAFNGNPAAYWDANGRFGKQAFQNANINPYAKEFKAASTMLDAYSATTDNAVGGGTAEFLSHFAHLAVNNGSPANYFNQATADYQAGGALNVANRYNLMRAPFQAFYGLNLIQGDGFGEHLGTLDRSVDWLNTVALVSGAGAGIMRPTAAVQQPPPFLGASSGTMALTRGTTLTVRLNSAAFTPEQINLIRARYMIANQRIMSGAERAIVGNQVEYVRDLSRRYVRDVLQLYPANTPLSKVRIPHGFNVDEFVSRQFGGRQVPANQNLLPMRINTALGPLEQNAASQLPDGTIIQSINIDQY